MVRHVSRASITMIAVLAFSVFLLSGRAAAYTQNSELERELENSDSSALALFPAAGFKDGVAGFFRTHALYVVPGSQRAWCAENAHGVLKRGCYVELYIQGDGLKPTDSKGDPCGAVGRWHLAPGSKHYTPTPGSFIANAMARGDWERVEFSIYEAPGTSRLLPGSCSDSANPEIR